MEGNVKVVELKQKYWMALTKGEVRSIGERRWVRKFKTEVLVCGGIAFFVAIVGAFVSRHSGAWGLLTVLPYVAFCLWMARSFNKAGKELVEECCTNDEKGQVKI